MPIRYRCDSCSQLLSIATKMAGLSIPCPRCGTPNIIPQPGTPPEQKSGTPSPAAEAPAIPAPVKPSIARPVLPPLPPIPGVAPNTSAVLSPVSPPPQALPPAGRDFAAADDAGKFVEPRESAVGNFGDDAEFERTMLSSAEDLPDVQPASDTILQPSPDDEPSRPEREARAKSRRAPKKRESAAESDSHAAAAFSLSRRGRNTDDEEMDLTPMVDMTFLLLIFFMITASFSMQKSINFPPPGAEKKGASQQLQSLDDLEEKAIIVRIDEQNAILVEDEPVGDVRQLASRFRNLMRSSGQNEVVVTAADAAFHETVVKVIDAANDAGVERIRLGATANE